MSDRLAEYCENFYPRVAGTILGHVVVSPSQLVTDIESNGHLSFTADLEITWDK